MHNSSLQSVIVPASEVSLRADDHVTGRHGNVRIPTQIVWRIGSIRHKVRGLLLFRNAACRALSIVDTVVRSPAQRKLGHSPLCMVRDKAHILREKGLVFFVNARRDVCPPEKCLRIRRPVIQAHPQFEVRFPRAQADAVHSLEPRHGVMVAAPDGDGTIRIALDRHLDGHEGC